MASLFPIGWALVFMVVAVGGCRQSPPATVPKVPEAQSQAKSKADSSPENAHLSAAKIDAAPPMPKPSVDDPAERLVLFTSSGPLLVQFRFQIDGKPLPEIRAELIDQMLALSDTDGDGKTSWAEALASPLFAGEKGAMGGANAEPAMKRGDRGIISLERLHDRNLDGLVDSSEAVRLASANDVQAGAFRLESEGRDQRDNPTESAAWQLLDVDEDQVLSAEELLSASARLKSRDADDNDLLEMAELSPSPAALARDPQRDNANVYEGQPRVMQLGSRARWDALVLAMIENYQEEGRIATEKYPLTARILAALDKNRDGKLSREESHGLNDMPAHLVITLNLAPSYPAPTVQALDQVGPVEIGPGEDPNQRRIRLPKFDIEFRIRDEAAALDLTLLAKGQFTALDRDGNAYLDAGEFTPAGGQLQAEFAAADADKDGKVTLDEVLALAKRQQQFLVSNVRGRPASADDLGFSVLDADSDRRLSLREMQGAAVRLKHLDADGDDRLTGAEMPRTLIVHLERGLSQQAAPQPARRGPSSTPASPAKSGPSWFDRMDSNADGDISPREFLGTPDQFQELDVDQDGFVSRAEAPPR